MVPRRAIFVPARHAALRCRLPARLTWMIASELYRAGFPAPADVLSAALDSGVAISIILIFFWCVPSFSFRSHLPPLPSLFFVPLSFDTNTTPTHTLHQSNLPHLTPSSPMSHRSSHLIYYTRYLYFPRSVLASFPYGRTHMLISSFSLLSPLFTLPYATRTHMACPLLPCAVCAGMVVWSGGRRPVCLLPWSIFVRLPCVYFDTAAPDADADVTCECLFNLNGRLQRMRNRGN